MNTAQGVLLGSEQDGVYRFCGIPYAAPPIGDRRWAPPAPPESWTGEREATAFGPACPQTVGAISALRTSEQSEDCLHLNIWTASLDPSARRPVMVWIHGGGNVGGAGSEEATDGSRLAARGVVVVTFNYRLGAFGFLAHPDTGTNFGLLDQAAALRWVNENIAAFGGDRDAVTAFGQSAGGVAVKSLLACPQAAGLFHRGIMQSGGFEDPAFPPGPSYERSRDATECLFDRLGSRDLAVLRTVAAEKVAEASHELSGVLPRPGQVHTPADLVWMPVIDGGTLLDDDAPAWGRRVPLLLGCTQNEARYFIKPGGTYGRDMLIQTARALCGPNADEAIAHFDQAGLEPYEAMDALFTAAIWTEPALQTLRHSENQGRPTYCYHFARLSPGALAARTLAMHSSDVRYVFGNLDDEKGYDPVDRRVSDAMQDAWVSFARSGIPEGPPGLHWPRDDAAEPLCAWIADDVTATALPVNRPIEILEALRPPPGTQQAPRCIGELGTATTWPPAQTRECQE